MNVYNRDLIPFDTSAIYVFGSNTEGRHGKGSARFAREQYGAIYGQASGLQGNSYAIITKDLTQQRHPSISKQFIEEQIKELYKFAKQHPHLSFYVAYSDEPGHKYNLNGYLNEELAEMFNCDEIPYNVFFEVNFAQLMTSIKEINKL